MFHTIRRITTKAICNNSLLTSANCNQSGGNNRTLKLIKSRNFHQKNSSRLNSSSVAAAHELQNVAMKEQCILVDEMDRCLGQVSKRECHRVNNGQITLHRAFSVFLFNTKGDMLVQQRSQFKITYPSHYTNACCSHPLYEVSQKKAIKVDGVTIC